MRKYSSLLTIASCLALTRFAAGQPVDSQEIPVLSQVVGSTIDIPEEEYYQIFGSMKGFLSAQFQETDTGFKAVIRTKRRWLTRDYTAREFYDLGLALDLQGPIDAEVLAELSGQIAFEKTVADLLQLPTGVQMRLFRDKGRSVPGIYEKFEGHHFSVRGRRGAVKRVPLEEVTRIWYRDPPVPDLKKDVQAHMVMALLGALTAAGWNWLFGAGDFDSRWGGAFAGGAVGLVASPFAVSRFRVLRAPVHTVVIPPEARDKIDIYAYLTFN